MSSQEQLLSILYDLSQTISSEVHLQPLLNMLKPINPGQLIHSIGSLA